MRIKNGVFTPGALIAAGWVAMVVGVIMHLVGLTQGDLPMSLRVALVFVGSILALQGPVLHAKAMIRMELKKIVEALRE